MKFKPGDKVKVISTGAGVGNYIGRVGIVSKYLPDRDRYPYSVDFFGYPSICFAEHELEGVK